MISVPQQPVSERSRWPYSCRAEANTITASGAAPSKRLRIVIPSSAPALALLGSPVIAVIVSVIVGFRGQGQSRTQTLTIASVVPEDGPVDTRAARPGCQAQPRGHRVCEPIRSNKSSREERQARRRLQGCRDTMRSHVGRRKGQLHCEPPRQSNEGLTGAHIRPSEAAWAWAAPPLLPLAACHVDAVDVTLSIRSRSAIPDIRRRPSCACGKAGLP
jgi:hypothetical protein